MKNVVSVFVEIVVLVMGLKFVVSMLMFVVVEVGVSGMRCLLVCVIIMSRMLSGVIGRLKVVRK